MFEVTGAEIQRLDDAELRTLIARLAIAELKARMLPISGVTAGGDQNAADGGLDIRVELSDNSYQGDFVPRVPLGFQVKKPDMGPSAIAGEMKPQGVLRTVLEELADSGGAYVIVSSQGSVADRPLQNRRKAMKDALVGHASAHKLYTDFYDRERLAVWINQYPGVAAWVRARIGRPLAGWQSLGDWSGARVGGDGKYIADGAACLVDARSKEQTVLPIVEGIDCIRSSLSEPRQCVRLIGMSGLGKTRLVQALFETDVGSNTLDPSLAVYTDYSETPDPTAKQLALHLIETGQRAIIVVDNCNPQTHSDLAKICGSSRSKISLITVEYDVGDEAPEQTEVFHLRPASPDAIGKWLKINFDHVSEVDRDRIAEFSGGNFRVAAVLAETLKRGETLGRLKDRELFRKIFQQRHNYNGDLLIAAEALSLVYSFDGTDASASGELALLAPIAGIDATGLYAFVIELKRRSVVQSRGRWRALLPHAIANRLAAQALERIPADQFDNFCAGIPARMQKSLTRRLGYLHDNDEAKQAIARWLKPDGPLGNLFSGNDQSLQILRNIAPVAPEAVLQRAEDEAASEFSGLGLHQKSSARWQFVMIIKSLAYDTELFDRAAILLSKFVAQESPNENHNAARGPFKELFHLHLSGTLAPPDQRRKLIRHLYSSADADSIRCGHLALRALLHSGHFSSSSNFDFGARPRDFGWHPPTYGDIWNWYSEGIDLAVELSADAERRHEIKRIVSAAMPGILYVEACLSSIEAATTEFLKDGAWLDGWFAVRRAIQFDGKDWNPEVKRRVNAIEVQLRPSDPHNVAKAYVLGESGSIFDILDLEADIEGESDYTAASNRLAQKAEALGRDFGNQNELLNQFLPEALRSDYTNQAFSFGGGLTQSSAPPAKTWNALRNALVNVPVEERNATILGGFLHKLFNTDALLGSTILDDMLIDPDMAQHLVYLQVQAGIDSDGIKRLRRAISSGCVAAHSFYVLTSGVVRSVPQVDLAILLDELCALENGTSVALEILHMALYCLKTDGVEVEGALLDIGHQLLLRTNYTNKSDVREHRVQQTIKECYSGPSGEQGARELCKLLKLKIAAHEVHGFELDYAFYALFEVQPIIALDELLLGSASDGEDSIYGSGGLNRQSPLERVDPHLLWSWADQAPNVRYPLISRSLNVFATKDFNDDNGLSSLFLEGLERAPDRADFLRSNPARMHPNGWSGHLSTILDRRCGYLEALADHSDHNVRIWVAEQISDLKQRANHERKRESEREEAFE